LPPAPTKDKGGIVIFGGYEMYEISFPTPDEMKKLKKFSTHFEFSDSEFIGEQFTILDDETIKLRTWARILAQRLRELNFSYIMASYYYQNGIPDEPYYDKTSNKYFPQFTENQHWSNKEGFEYYSEVFLFKSFSALDTIAHILSINYGIKWPKISFNKSIVDRLLEFNPEKFERLKGIIESGNFNKIRTHRHNATHNISPGQVDSGLFTDQNGMTISSTGRYTPVSERYRMMTSLKNDVFEVVDIVKQK